MLSGIGLVLTGDEFGWGDTFVLIGIGVVVVDGILEGAVFGPRTKKIAESAEDRTSDYLRLLTTASVVHIVLLAFAVWAMVVKVGV